MKPVYISDKQKSAYEALKEKFSLKNSLQTPRLLKAIVSVGVGSMKDKKKLEVVADRLSKITGQKASPRPAKKSIASFKSREGEVVGFQVTMRGKRMRSFLDRLLLTAFPRTKDFRGVFRSSVDSMGNATFGIKEHVIFPETADEELKDIFGLAVTVTTTAKDRNLAVAFFEHLGFPFRTEDVGEGTKEKKKRKRVRRKKAESAAPAPAA